MLEGLVGGGRRGGGVNTWEAEFGAEAEEDGVDGVRGEGDLVGVVESEGEFLDLAVELAGEGNLAGVEVHVVCSVEMALQFCGDCVCGSEVEEVLTFHPSDIC